MTRNKPLQIALLADVHGNLPALEAVLTHARKKGFDRLWYLGDFLGYVPFPNEVIDSLRAEKAVCILGNYDQKVLDFARKKKKWKKSKASIKYAAFKWNHKYLSENNRRFLQALPSTHRKRCHGMEVQLVHGSPLLATEPLTPATPLVRLRELAAATTANLIVSGHSHTAFRRKAGSAVFVNPGSVGRPGGGDPRAAYMRLTLSQGVIKTRQERVDYDIERTGRAIHAAGLSRSFYKAISTGRIDVETP